MDETDLLFQCGERKGSECHFVHRITSQPDWGMKV